MGSASNISSATAKTPSIAAGLLSSVSPSFSSGQLVAEGLFSDILTQNQPPPAPPAPPQQQNNNTQGGQTPSSQTGPTSGQNTQTNNSQNNSTNSGTQLTNHPAVSHAGTGTGNTPYHYDAKQAGEKSKPSNTGDQSAGSTAITAQTSISANTSANSASAPVAASASTAQNNSADNGAANNNSNTNSNPVNPPALPADLNAVYASAVPAAPVSPQATNASQVSGDNANSGNPSANGNVNASQLMLMPMQLQGLAVPAQLANPVSFNANALMAQSPNGSAPVAGTDNSKGQIDLKALLAASQSNGGNFLGGDTSGLTNSTGVSQGFQNIAAPANTAPANQNTQQPVNSPQTQQSSADTWMNANFVNVFNLNNAGQNNNPLALALNALINPGATSGSGDGASLDNSGQGQNETGSHGLSANASLNNTLPQTAGPAEVANPYDFASQLSAMRATKGGATGLPTPVEQVMLQLSRGLSKDGSTQMTIQLRPAELGRIDVKLNVDSSGKVQGTVTADNPATLGLLLKDVRGLERALQEAGLRADSGSLQFNLRGDGQAGGSFNQTANNSSGSSGGSSPEAQTSLPVFVDPAETYYLTPGGVNMRV